MNFWILPLSSLLLAVTVSGHNWGQTVVVDPAPIYQPKIEKTYKYEKEVKVPVVETVPVATGEVAGPILRTNGRINGQPIVVGHGHKSIEQYVPVQRGVVPTYVQYDQGPVRSKVEVKTTYRSDVPAHTAYREIPVKSVGAPVVSSYREIGFPARTVYPSYTLPIQTSYRSVHVPAVQTGYRSVHAPVRTVYSSGYVPYQSGQKSIHSPSVVGFRYW